MLEPARQANGITPEEPDAAERTARALREFGPVGIAAFLVIALLGPPWFRGLLVLAWAAYSRTPWRELGFARPKSWARILVIGMALGCVLKLVMKAVVMPLLGADPINQIYHYLVGNRAALPGIFFLVTVSAGFGEETVFRGYFFERFRKLFGEGKGAIVAIILLTSILFALPHYPEQELAGAEQALVMGLVFGTIFALTRQLWLPMIVHVAFDLTAVAIIYYDFETKVAQFIFK